MGNEQQFHAESFFSQRRKGAKKDNTLLKKSLNNEDLDLVFAIPTAFLKQQLLPFFACLAALRETEVRSCFSTLIRMIRCFSRSPLRPCLEAPTSGCGKRS
jgi:hypothetical protein